jgi:hypothetical protein
MRNEDGAVARLSHLCRVRGGGPPRLIKAHVKTSVGAAHDPLEIAAAGESREGNERRKQVSIGGRHARFSMSGSITISQCKTSADDQILPCTSFGCGAALLSHVADMSMSIQALHIGMKIRHPNHGVGTVKSLTEHTAEIVFDDQQRTIAPETSDLTPAEAAATVTDLQLPLDTLIRQTAQAVVDALNLEKPEATVTGLANRWQRGTLVMQAADSSLQPKEVPLETFFHKIVMIRNNLRVLEQKVNSSAKLSDADKFDLQQYITRCYGSLTTFNILFKNKEDQFSTSK